MASENVASLQAMFPSYDAEVLQVLLEENGGSLDRTIDTVLRMTDPEYAASNPPQGIFKISSSIYQLPNFTLHSHRLPLNATSYAKTPPHPRKHVVNTVSTLRRLVY